MTSNGDADNILDQAEDTLYRLRDLTPREVLIHIPTREERRQAEIEADERAREQGKRELREQEAAAADAVELAAAEAEVEHEAGWEEWLATRLAAERQTILDIMAEVVGEAMGTLREEFGTKAAELTRQAEAERNARRRERDAARERVKTMQATYAEKIRTLQAQLDAQQRAIGLLEVRLHKTKTETARHAETEAAVAVMLRSLYEEMLLRR
jgi:hypothetical protein